MAYAMTRTATLSCNVPALWDPSFSVPEQRCCDTLSVCVVSHRHHLKPHVSNRGEDGHVNNKLSVLEVADGHVHDGVLACVFTEPRGCLLFGVNWSPCFPGTRGEASRTC